MPTEKAKQRAKEDAREGKSPSTQAGEFVREEIEEIRKGKHGARSPKQAIAIGLSEARRAGVKLPPYKGKKSAAPAEAGRKKRSPKRAAASLKALKKEPHDTVSREALSKQAHAAAQRRGPSKRHQAAKKAAHTRQQHAQAR